MKKTNVAKMVPLQTFIDLLIDVYNEGFDYADVRCMIDEEGLYHINISVNEEYLTKEEDNIPPTTEEDYLKFS